MNTILLTLALAHPAIAADTTKPVKVFILAGQSNMQGKAKVSLMDYQAKQPATAELYKHWVKDGKWIDRDDVWVRYHEVAGPLTVGYHMPKSIGPELEFGTVVGDRYKEQVLIIKPAWGGRSLYQDFRSPSAGLPSEKVLNKMLEQRIASFEKQKNKKPDAAKPTMDDVKKSFGASYREMMEEVNGTLADIKKYFPDYAGQGYELAGFVWFQGWNDMINGDATAEYAANMKHFINDVRKDLKSPKLPVVIGQMGVDGEKATGNVVKFKAAQAAVLDEPEFKGNVALVKTDVFWDMDADAIFRKGWKNNVEEWNKVGSDFPFHYLGSPKTMMRIGRAFGEAMLSLRGEKQ